jgi:putative transposase
MARIARVVVPGLPHHLTQRGNRREPVFSRPTTIASIGD